jgi:hypothetical protein
VLWVARRQTGLTLVELGRKAGGMDYAAVTTRVYPGHGATTTISDELRVNPFMKGMRR